jgi:hypothetical protein
MGFREVELFMLSVVERLPWLKRETDLIHHHLTGCDFCHGLRRYDELIRLDP